jgi:hypothetical protein
MLLQRCHRRMHSVQRRPCAWRRDWQQILLRDSKILSRSLVHAVLGAATRHEHVERIIASEQKHADERTVIVERCAPANYLRVRQPGRRCKYGSGTGFSEEAASIHLCHYLSPLTPLFLVREFG